jgi:hypothetical protein
LSHGQVSQGGLGERVVPWFKPRSASGPRTIHIIRRNWPRVHFCEHGEYRDGDHAEDPAADN